MKNFKLLTALATMLLCTSIGRAQTDRTFTRIGVNVNSWQSFALPMNIDDTELSRWFDKVYIPDDGTILFYEDLAGAEDGDENTAIAPKRMLQRAGGRPEMFEEENGYWGDEDEEEIMPRGSFGYCAEGSNALRIYMADYSDEPNFTIPTGFPFFAHVKTDAQLTSSMLTLRGYLFDDEMEDGNEIGNIEKGLFVYTDQMLQTEDEDKMLNVIGLLENKFTASTEETPAYFAIDPNSGHFHSIGADEMEINHAYISAMGVNFIASIAKPTTELNTIQQLSVLDLTDANPTLVPGTYEAGDISYTRTLNNCNYNGFYLPFAIDLSTLTSNFEAVYTPAGFVIYNPSTDILTMFLKDRNMQTEILPAYTPFLAKTTEPYQDVFFSAANNTVLSIVDNQELTPLEVYDYGTNGGLATTSRNFKMYIGGSLVGVTYDNSDLRDLILTFKSDYASLAKFTNGKAFRVLVRKQIISESASSAARVECAFMEGNEATMLDYLRTDVETEDGIVYSIDGRKVGTADCINQLSKGIYIINGKKIIK